MTRRPSRPLLRVGFAIQAILLLAMQVVDGSGVHRCPDHDAGVGVLAGAAAPMEGHHHGGQHDGSGSHQGLCPCLAPCHSAGHALAAAAAPALVSAPIVPFQLVADFTPTIRLHAPQLLPFALGPPRLA